MAITTLSSREFNQDAAKAKRAAHVLLSIKEYQQITNKGKSILDLLAMPEMAEIDVDFEFPRMGGEFPKPVDWS